MKTLAIIGSGHLGQQLAHFAISDSHYGKVVFFDDYTDAAESNGHSIIGKTSAVEEAFALGRFDELMIGIGYNHMNARKAFFDKYCGKIPFGKIIHSSCTIDHTAKIGEGVIIYPGCIIDARVLVKDNVLINIGCAIAHDSIVSEHCFLSPRVTVAGFVTIGERCIAGINSTIIDNIKIDANVQLGGGAVVIKNIDKEGLYVGNPVRFVR